MKKKLLSGIQPSGAPHIGNYFGAMKQFVDMQSEYESNFMIANLHAITTVQDKERLSALTYDVAVDYLAIGLSPEQAVIFKQSDVQAHTELTWIFNCLVTVPYLERAHAFKDKSAKGIEASVGLFDYPVLMAADILLYDPDVVPVGQDQRQHVEYARDIAQKFNNVYGEVFKLPEAYIKEDVAIVPGTDGQKMSKSYNNYIPLFASDAELEKQVMSIVTDSKAPEESKDPEQDNVYALHKLFTPGEELAKIREGYEKGGLGYGESKKILLKYLKKFIEPLREKREKIAQDRDFVLGVLEDGAKKAYTQAESKMQEVREKVGLV